jgi:hypothetical protein
MLRSGEMASRFHWAGRINLHSRQIDKIGVVIPTNDMHSDITTLENHLKVMRDYRKRRKNECGA